MIMSNSRTIKAFLFSAFIWAVATYNAEAQSMTDRTHKLGEVTVTTMRPMKEIGVQKTAFDSLALKENISLSMADILAYNSSVFVKNYGRATLSTVAFRGTSPSHTQVTWNGMRINNPMLGMTDFSTIPAYFIDNAALLHGASSVNEAGGGIGGLVRLGTSSDITEGFNMQYIQGVGSFSTFDEFARITFSNEKWKSSTRIVHSSSPNDYKYINHDKKVNIYDDNHNIIGQYYPKERNRSGAFRDFHFLQEVYYDNLKGDRFGINMWYINSDRELPILTTDYGNERKFENKQRENSFRTVVTWNHIKSKWKAGINAGYSHTSMKYDYKREVSDGNWAAMTRSRSKINTLYGHAEGEYTIAKKWLFTANLSAYQHFVDSRDNNVGIKDDKMDFTGYDKGRVELSGSVSAKWQPVDRLGLSVVMREEMFGYRWAPVIPAFFIDGLLLRKWNLTARASVTKNHRFPSLNDLYFLPGGNPDLKSEDGFTYDAGLSFSRGIKDKYEIGGSLSWFDSYINDWIIWLPTTKGFFSPRNVKDVHAYGIELKSNFNVSFAKGWNLDFSGSYSWTPSINEGEKMSPADQSVGKQLPYVPKHSASFTGRLSWKRWSFLYKWSFYSERYTMSSNDYTISGHLPKYYMSNVSLEKGFSFRSLDLSVKLAVNNLFNEDYLSVLSRPMPGINYELFISITPKFKKNRNYVNGY